MGGRRHSNVTQVKANSSPPHLTVSSLYSSLPSLRFRHSSLMPPFPYLLLTSFPSHSPSSPHSLCHFPPPLTPSTLPPLLPALLHPRPSLLPHPSLTLALTSPSSPDDSTNRQQLGHLKPQLESGFKGTKELGPAD